MDTLPKPAVAVETKKRVALRVFGVGNAGITIIERMAEDGPAAETFVAVNPDAQRLAASSIAEKLHLESRPLRGLGSGGDPERARSLAEEHAEKLQAYCQEKDVIFIVAGLGGGAGSGISPVIARLAKDAGALVLALVTLPFDCEGSRRRGVAAEAAEELRDVVDALICLPNQRVFGLLQEQTCVLDAFNLTNQMLADCGRSIWRLLTHSGPIEIHWPDLCDLLRGEHTDCAFAVVEAAGATRSREVVDKLLAHPLLEEGRMLTGCQGMLVSLMGGPDLTMTEIDRVMQELSSRCGSAQVIMGAIVDESFRERLTVTVITVRPPSESPESLSGSRRSGENLDQQLIKGSGRPRPGSRFVPPPPALPPDQVQQMLARQGATRPGSRKALPRFRQAQLPLEIVSKGRFDKSEPTIHKGEDLDVPTYIRRGVSLN